MSFRHCLFVCVACTQAFRVRRNHARRHAAAHSNNSTAAAWAQLTGFYRTGRWRDLFRQDLAPEPIGRGTFGAAMKVTLAPICRTSEQVVVKQIQLGGEVDSKMLNNELQIQQAISDHPNLVGLYDYHPQDPRAWPREGSVYVMMPLADGGHVDRAYWQEVKANDMKTGKIEGFWEYFTSGWVDDKEHEAEHRKRNALVSRIAMDIFSGLAYMHSKKYVHRDLKPGNIWASHKSCMTKFSASCKYMIGDFGISAPEAIANKRACGTPAFMPPEIETGGAPFHYTYSYRTQRIGWTVKGDVYALGITLMSILTGYEVVTQALGRQIFNIESYLHHNILGLDKHLKELLIGVLAPEPGRRKTAQEAYDIAAKAYAAANSGRPPPSLPPTQAPLCVKECKRMSCCYNLRCALLDGKCDDVSDPNAPRSRTKTGLGLWDLAAGVVGMVRKGLGWIEEEGVDEPLGPVPPKILPTGKFCYGQDEIPAGERVMPGLLIPQERVDPRPAPGGSFSNQDPGAKAPQRPSPPKLALVGPNTLRVTWIISQTEPPVSSISVGVRLVGGQTFVVDATDNKNLLVPEGGQPVRAPTTFININIQPGQTYQAMVSFRNSVGASTYSEASDSVAVPVLRAQRNEPKLPPLPPPILQSAPQPTLAIIPNRPNTLEVRWTIPDTSPPVQSITVGIRVVGEKHIFMVNTTDGKNLLLATGGLPVLAPTDSIAVPVQPGKTYDAMIAMKNSACLTPWSQPSAPVVVPRSLPEVVVPMYVEGQPVSYFSQSQGIWLDARVIKVDARGVQVDLKPGWPVGFDELPTKMKPREEAIALQVPTLAQNPVLEASVRPSAKRPGAVVHTSRPLFFPRQPVRYLTSRGAWMDATVVNVDARGVELDIEPGIPVPPNEVTQRLKPRQ